MSDLDPLILAAYEASTARMMRDIARTTSPPPESHELAIDNIEHFVEVRRG